MATTKELGAGAFSNNTVIGPSILINGRLTGDEDLTVRGRVEGEVSLSHTLIVEQSGVVKANVSVKNAIISGVVVGNISATESVELTREGRMVGDIRSPRVIIVDGASFRGRVDMGEGDGRPIAERPATARPVSRPTIRPASISVPPRPVAKAVATKPQPPPAPLQRAETRAPAPPPSPVLVGESGKKKVLVKKKK